MYINPVICAAILGLASAAPLEIRQTGTSSSEFSQGGCRPILFAWARGSTEAGNMGTVVGPPTSDGLKKNFGANNVATEGINYAAALAPNSLPGGTDTASKELMKTTLTKMATQCPDSIIVAGGYSQGAAVNHRAVSEVSPDVQAKIAGVILYGDTQKLQDKSQIPNFPADKVDIICQPGDLVCTGSLVITAAHLTYGVRANEGVDFLTKQIKAAQGNTSKTGVIAKVANAARDALAEVL